MLLVFARTFARTARNCSHQKPNPDKPEPKLTAKAKKKHRRFNLELRNSQRGKKQLPDFLSSNLLFFFPF